MNTLQTNSRPTLQLLNKTSYILPVKPVYQKTLLSSQTADFATYADQFMINDSAELIQFSESTSVV